MKKSSFVIILVLIMLAGSLFAQDIDVARLRQAALDNTFGSRPVSQPFQLIDFSKLQFSHSYSLSFLSGGSTSGSVGNWNTSMFYEFSPKLSLNVDLNMMHTGGNLSNLNDKTTTVLPAFSLDYHPSNNFSITVGYARINPYYSASQYNRFGFGQRNNLWFLRDQQ